MRLGILRNATADESFGVSGYGDTRHRRRPLEIYQQPIGENFPPIRREDVKGS